MLGLRFQGRLAGVVVYTSRCLPHSTPDGTTISWLEYCPGHYIVSREIFDNLCKTTDPPRERFVD